MEKEIQLLCRVAINHLFLAQFEPFRACLLSLRSRNPSLSFSILHTIISQAGRFDHILWSPSCPSPSHLTYLSALEFLNTFQGIHPSSSSFSSLDPDLFRLKVEFLLLVQLASSNLSENLQNFLDIESIEKQEESSLTEFESRPEDLARSADLESSSSSTSGFDSVSILNRVSDLGFWRLKGDGVRDVGSSGVFAFEFTDIELKWLRKVFLDQAEVFDVLCRNIQKQVNWTDPYDSGLAISVRRDDDGEAGVGPSVEGDDLKGLGWIHQNVQLAHLDALKECLDAGDKDAAVSHLRFFHLDFGLEESNYRRALRDLITRVWSQKDAYGDTWFALREKMLMMYGEALSSNCIQLVQMFQGIQDELLTEEIEQHRTSDAYSIPPPLQRVLNYFEASDLGDALYLDDRTSWQSVPIRSCMSDMYHYARVSGLHTLECVMDTALSAIKRGQLREASYVISLFPLLQPLVAVMGWDLLSGKTMARKKLMQLLWTSKSQVLRLEEFSLYGKKLDEISCVEHLCDVLCYQLDLASFAAYFNSGRPWNSKASLLFSERECKPDENKDEHLDPFVENFVLERLAVQSPLRVLFDVVPGIKFQDAIELIGMQPVASSAAAWKRMQDIDLMHMRYALESAVLALGAMEKSATDENESHYRDGVKNLKDLQNHLEAIGNNSRKILMVNIIIALLHMDDISINLTNCASSSGSSESPHISSLLEEPDHGSCEGGNEIVVSFIGLLLDALRRNLPSAGPELDRILNSGIAAAAKKALEWRISNAKHFMEDWEWRLSILQRLLPLSERHWNWKEALAILRAAPSKLLNLCMQRAKYDIGEEAVHRFSLPPEDKATLELAEWVDGAFKRASVRTKLLA